jgi:cell division protein FtsB
MTESGMPAFKQEDRPMKRLLLFGIPLALMALVALGTWLALRNAAQVESDEDKPARTAREYEQELSKLVTSRGLPAAQKLAQLVANADPQSLELLREDLTEQQKRPEEALQEARRALEDIKRTLAATSDSSERDTLERHKALVESIIGKLEMM